MKKLVHLLNILPAIVLSFLLSGCFKDKLSKTYTMMIPVWETKATVLSQVNSGPPKQLASPGKIFIKGRYLFINEVNEGIHIIDNTDPSLPKPVAFIDIPGNLDVAVKGNYLYADMYSDMLTINITDPLNVKLEDTAANVFPERSYGGWSPSGSSMVIVDWIRKDTTVDVSVAENGWGGCNACFFMDASAAVGNFSKAGTIVTGIGGSMARFTVVGNFLYTVNYSALGVFNISDASNPSRTGDYPVGWSIETIYPFNNRLFIGSSSGMFIYNINQPSAPEQEGTFSHARACDPVVADDRYAFVTLRSGTTCDGYSNQLDVIDITDVLNPKWVKTYPLSNPHGLGKDGDLLFICDGSEGVKVYDASNVENLKMIKHLKGVTAYDVIPWSSNLIVVGEKGLYQFDYSNTNDIRLISTIKVSRK